MPPSKNLEELSAASLCSNVTLNELSCTASRLLPVHGLRVEDSFAFDDQLIVPQFAEEAALVPFVAGRSAELLDFE